MSNQRGQIGANWIGKGADTHAECIDIGLAIKKAKKAGKNVVVLRKKQQKVSIIVDRVTQEALCN